MPLIQKPKQSDRPLDKSAGAPRLVKRLHLAGRLITIYGFLWLLVFGYQYAIVDEKPYAQMGLVTFAVILILCGGWLSGIYSRWYAAKTEGELFAALRVTYAGALPTGLIAFVMQCVLASCLVIDDSYSLIKVRATEPVKEELRWLLGDNYPHVQELNIDQESLEWEFTTEKDTGIATRLLKAFSPSATERDKEYFSKQLNRQSYEITWDVEDQHYRKALDLDWDNAELFSTHEIDDAKSYPMCNLYVPILNPVLHDETTYQLLFRGGNPDSWMVDRQPLLFNRPTKQLPPKLRIEDGRLVIRTNFVGRRWSTYCAINFPANDKFYEPEPITTRSMTDLNMANHQLHFHLFRNLINNILHFQVNHYRRRATFAEFLDQLNKLVALDILDTQIRGNMLVPRY